MQKILYSGVLERWGRTVDSAHAIGVAGCCFHTRFSRIMTSWTSWHASPSWMLTRFVCMCPCNLSVHATHLHTGNYGWWRNFSGEVSLEGGCRGSSFSFVPFHDQVQIRVSRCFLNWNQGDHQERWSICQEILPSLVISFSVLQPSLEAGNVYWVLSSRDYGEFVMEKMSQNWELQRYPTTKTQ